MRERTPSENGPGTDRPDGREVTVSAGREAPPGTSQVSRARAEACRAEVRAVCLREFAAGKLPLQFVGVEMNAGGRAATVFFTSEARVDFRDLSRSLGRELRMRVTMHRLGPRDVAKRAGTCGPCGRALCCKSFLSGFPSVSVKLVKQQKFPLTPERSSGMCGRLKCCLAFERGDGACHLGDSGACRSVDLSAGEAGNTPRVADS
jgi:cell fate regulator YaaT (PSP1 superfamily)